MTGRLVAEIELHSSTLDQALDVAAASYRRLPVALRQLDPRVLSLALRLAGDNPRRISTDGDGSAVIHNGPVW